MKCFVIGITVFFATMSLGSLSAHGDIITADVAVLSSDGQYAVLASGEQNSDWYQYVWCDIPAFAIEQEVLFWRYVHTGYPNLADGLVTFKVLDDGPVLMACTTRWDGGGNSDGDWEDDLTTRDELEQQGWAEFATGLSLHHAGYDTEPCIPYVVFSRC